MDSRNAHNLNDGDRYAIALHTLFGLSAIKTYTNWNISNELESAGKFDDLVFESDEKCIWVQAKVKSGKINTNNFMTVNPKKIDFSIAKYFLSYLTIKKPFIITRNSLILCTAADLNVADIMDETKTYADKHFQKIFGAETKKYKIKNEEKDVDKLLKVIKQFQDNNGDAEWTNLDINREDVKAFICYFVVVKINLASIETLIRDKLSELNKCLKFKPSNYEYVKHHVGNWSHLKSNKFVAMTEDYLMFILCGENNRLFLHKFVNLEIYFQKQTLYEFDSNIICVQPHDNIAMHLLKIFRSIQNAKGSYLEENTLCLMQKMENTLHRMEYTMEYKVVCDMINTFRCNKIKYLVVSFLALDEDKSLELYEKICTIIKEDSTKKVFIIIKEHQFQKSKIPVQIIKDKKHFNSLETKTKQHIYAKEIQFQGEMATLNNLIIINAKNMNTELDDYEIEIDESLKEIIFSEDSYSIGSNMQAQSKHEKLYVKRRLMVNSEEFPEIEFFKKIDKNIVVVTGPPGAGKTTLLKQIVSLKKAKDKEDSKLTWIIKVDLTDFKKIFRNDIGKTMIDLLCHNELTVMSETPDGRPNYAPFEKKLIESVDKILIIDSIDENCSEDIEKLLKLLADPNSLQALNISLVIMGARDYDFILNRLNVLRSCELVRVSPFSPNEQSSFLKEYLAQLIPAANIEYDLFEKLTNLAPAFKDICSTPLSLEMVCKIINNKISKDRPIESWSELFNNIKNQYNFYSSYVQVIKDEVAQDNNILRVTFEEHYIDSLRKFAAKNLFSDLDLLRLLNVDANFDIPKYVLNTKLLKEWHEGYKFVHKTFEEYFAAELLWDCLYKKRHSHDLLLKVLDSVFLDGDFKYKGILYFFEKILEINQNEKLYELSMAYNSVLTKENCKNYDISGLCNNNYLFIIKLVFDKYTKFYDILKFDNWNSLNFLRFSELSHLPILKYFVGIGARVNKVNEIGFIILTFTFKDCFKIFDDVFDKSRLDFLKILHTEYNIDLNYCDDYGNTISHYAALCKSLNAIKYLKEQGANLNISNNQKQTLVHRAVASGDFKILQYLVEDCKMDVNVADVDGKFPVHNIYMRDNIDILKYLKDKGANLSISNNQKQTLVHKAAKSGGLKVLRYLVEDCKMDVNVADVDGKFPVHNIYMRDDIDILKYLKDKGANLSISNNQKQTLVHKAAKSQQSKSGGLKVLRYLVEDCKMDVNVSDVDGNLPAHMAAEFSDDDILKYLKEKGANLSISNNQKQTLVHKAAKFGYLKVLQYLVEDCKMDVNVADVNGNFPVHMIDMRYYNIDILKYLKDKGANLGISNNQKQTLVHKAAESGDLKALQYLVEDCKMDVNVYDVHGNLPVHMIDMRYHSISILKYLKDKGANLSISNIHKHTLIHKAAQSGDLEVLQYLVENCKMDVNVSDVDGNVPAHFAAKSNKVEILRYLKTIGSDLNQRNHQRATLVDMAAAEDAVDVLNFLKGECNFSLNLDSRDNDGFTPSHCAAFYNALKSQQ
uniref:Uncharacterized protein LOC114338418 n=1 Tax=Diabrotica virgifera virgifera TaxID=50390 RepID=A0A6P7GEX0_DIAVI